MDTSKVKTLFFDYDGTLHDSLYIYKPAFLKAYKMLVEKGFMKPRIWCDEDIAPFLGQNPKAMWDSFGKDLPEEMKKAASALIGKTMDTLIKAKKARLYPNALSTLKTLKSRGYTLVFISNCRTNYMKLHTEMFHLDAVFSTMVCAEMYDYIPKARMLKKIKPNFDHDMAIIGDRHHDMTAGKTNDIITVGCTYGFGQAHELAQADIQIESIETLLDYFK